MGTCSSASTAISRGDNETERASFAVSGAAVPSVSYAEARVWAILIAQPFAASCRISRSTDMSSSRVAATQSMTGCAAGVHKAPHFRASARRLVPPTSWLLLDYLTRLVSRLPLLVVIRGKHRKSRVICATRYVYRDRAPNGHDRMRLSGRAT